MYDKCRRHDTEKCIYIQLHNFFLKLLPAWMWMCLCFRLLLLKANESTCNDGNLSYTCWFSSLALDEPSEPLSPLFKDIKFILRMKIEEEKSQNDLK